MQSNRERHHRSTHRDQGEQAGHAGEEDQPIRVRLERPWSSLPIILRGHPPARHPEPPCRRSRTRRRCRHLRSGRRFGRRFPSALMPQNEQHRSAKPPWGGGKWLLVLLFDHHLAVLVDPEPRTVRGGGTRSPDLVCLVKRSCPPQLGSFFGEDADYYVLAIDPLHTRSHQSVPPSRWSATSAPGRSLMVACRIRPELSNAPNGREPPAPGIPRGDRTGQYRKQHARRQLSLYVRAPSLPSRSDPDSDRSVSRGRTGLPVMQPGPLPSATARPAAALSACRDNCAHPSPSR